MQKSFLLAISISVVLSLCITLGCSDDQAEGANNTRLFSNIPASTTRVDFQNTLIETESSNYFKYMYSYIGGGVAAADFNNDDLEDLFFISNQDQNKLFLNRGDLKFDDVTQKSKLINRPGFDAGVSIVDINSDGWLDIYISRGGWNQENDAFANMLFVNTGKLSEEGIPSFTEEAESYGIADRNRSIQSTFFDFDKDGNLDLYVSNTPDFDDPASEIVDLIAVQGDPATLDKKGSDQLYQNNGDNTFTNISVKAGIMPDIGFGLNPQVGDLNNDGWLDIYVCNDFRIPDFVYLNNTDGTFREGRNEVLRHMSFNSMGGDIADINNDGLQDIFTLDMNPEDYIRSKTTMGMTSQSRFEEMVAKDYHYQYMHNMLHLNTGQGSYSEISKLAGLANSDWSWSCLLADFDLDGYNDAYVTNGVFRDVIDRDANNRIVSELRKNNRKPSDRDFLSFAKMLPQQKLVNYIFRNNGDLTFDNVSSIWSDSISTLSNGAVYADLDNDGDLEIIVNNINEDATILKNNAVEFGKGNYVKVKLNGSQNNKDGVGAIVKIETSSNAILTRQLIRTRGFLSSVSGVLHFGLNSSDSIQSVSVIWPDSKIQIVKNVEVNQMISLDYDDAREEILDSPNANILFNKLPLQYKHEDPPYNDYELQILLPHKLSQTGPAVAVGDVNGDNLEDIYLGGGHTQSGQLLLGIGNDQFKTIANSDFERDKRKEDVDAVFFDADNDGDQDLYVVSGSYEFRNQPRNLMDRLYLNDGQGKMKKDLSAIPQFAAAGSVVAATDFDNDGDIDLFVGSRVVPGRYPFAPTNYFLINNEGKFSIQTQNIIPEAEEIGMITDAKWADIDSDGDADLIVTGEWMGIEIFLNSDGKLKLSKNYASLSSSKGWWNTIEIEDIDSDGDLDIIAGNLGLNAKFHATQTEPFHVYTNDFDFNGSTDVFLAKKYKDREVPVRGKSCSTQQLPHLANKIKTYNEFAISSLADIIGPGIKSALHLEATEFRSGIFVNDGGQSFSFHPFENSTQRSPINSILYKDVDKDGVKDLLLAGNNHMPEIETTKYDAGIGAILKGFRNGEFVEIPNNITGFWATKDVRNVQEVKSIDGSIIVIINNNDTHEFYKL